MNNQIKTFPIKLTVDKHKEIAEAAYIARVSIQQYIQQAIDSKLIKDKE